MPDDSLPLTAPVIQFDRVTKQYGSHTVLSDFSLTIHPAETVVLMGPSGCGKTTALRCINGLEKIQQGLLTVNGVNLAKVPHGFSWNRFRAGIGMVFQQYNLFPHLTVLDNITLGPLRVQRQAREKAEATALGLLARVGLRDKADRYPHGLSGGEKQRVAIARALAMSPDILLFDEPTSALDPLMAGEVLTTMQDLDRQNNTLVIVTHEIRFACRVADRIVFMDQGRIAMDLTPEGFQALESSSEPKPAVVQAYLDRLMGRTPGTL